MPVFMEGAAKSHFGWHLQAGANAFDVFPPGVFKEKILEFPYAEAPRMADNMTRLDFGWWNITTETTPDNTEAIWHRAGLSERQCRDRVPFMGNDPALCLSRRENHSLGN